MIEQSFAKQIFETMKDKSSENMLFNSHPFEGQIYTKYDYENQLLAIIAIHSLKRGPALGGCRLRNYATLEEALYDATRLAKGMSYKAAMSGLPYGGGKAVLIKTNPHNMENYFKSFAQFINSLNGNYITTVDSGLTVADLNIMANYTTFVTGHTGKGFSGDPSPATARGVVKGIEAAVKVKFNRNDLEGLHIAIQGVGGVGYYLAKELFSRGVKLTISDINVKAITRCTDEFKVDVVAPELIHTIPCDIFAPCALGATLNQITIPMLSTSIIAGCANNQLANNEDGLRLAKRNILYAPDYVINAGGLIDVASQYSKTPKHEVNKQINAIYDRLLEIFYCAMTTQQTTNEVADKLAEKLL